MAREGAPGAEPPAGKRCPPRTGKGSGKRPRDPSGAGEARPRLPRFRRSADFWGSHPGSEPGRWFRGAGSRGGSRGGPPALSPRGSRPLLSLHPPSRGSRSSHPAVPRYRSRAGHPQNSPLPLPLRRPGMLRGRCGPAGARWPRGPALSPLSREPGDAGSGHSALPPPPPVPAPPPAPAGLLGEAGGGAPGTAPAARQERGRDRHRPGSQRPSGGS